MATAVQGSASAKATDGGDRLLPASLLAAGFLIVGLGLVGYGIPKALVGVLPGSSFAITFFRVVIQVAAIVGVIYLGSRLAGAHPIRGLRGGAFLVLATLVIAFLLWRTLSFAAPTGSLTIVAAVLGALALFGVYKFLTSPRAHRWMLALEEQGWFHTFSFKRTQGLKMRRYTIIGILAIGLSGVWTMMSHKMIGEGDLNVRLPFVKEKSQPDAALAPTPADKAEPVNPEKTPPKGEEKARKPKEPDYVTIAVLADKQFAVPLILAAAILWLAWRAVNMPGFADFLIATEAEMNKVSWTPRRRLFQDTMVVLITTLLLTAFLLVIDLFWGWLLSLSFIGVLPSKEDLQKLRQNNVAPTEQQPW